LDYCIPIKLSSDLDISGFSDEDWATNKEERKSVAGYGTFLEHSLITCPSRKQKVVSRTSAESEYKVLANLAAQVA